MKKFMIICYAFIAWSNVAVSAILNHGQAVAPQPQRIAQQHQGQEDFLECSNRWVENCGICVVGCAIMTIVSMVGINATADRVGWDKPFPAIEELKRENMHRNRPKKNN